MFITYTQLHKWLKLLAPPTKHHGLHVFPSSLLNFFDFHQNKFLGSDPEHSLKLFQRDTKNATHNRKTL